MQIQENLSWLLLLVSSRAKKGLIALAEKDNLTAMQAFTLCLLDPEKVVPMSSISKLLACDASNVTGIVDKLVASSYINRKESDTDRRVHTISITSKGAALRNEYLETITREYLSNMSRLSEVEQETFKNLLSKILAESPSK
jgi:DNA-binding MarR family transcriptional regulator